MQGIGDVEHVVPVAQPSLWVLVGEVMLHLRQVEEVIIQVLEGKLIVLDHLHELDLLELEQLLRALEYLLSKLPGEHLVSGHIVL